MANNSVVSTKLYQEENGCLKNFSVGMPRDEIVGCEKDICPDVCAATDYAVPEFDNVILSVRAKQPGAPALYSSYLTESCCTAN